jgi:hypothetical protein
LSRFLVADYVGYVCFVGDCFCFVHFFLSLHYLFFDSRLLVIHLVSSNFF